VTDGSFPVIRAHLVIPSKGMTGRAGRRPGGWRERRTGERSEERRRGQSGRALPPTYPSSTHTNRSLFNDPKLAHKRFMVEGWQ
jgi:hypothetical protein